MKAAFSVLLLFAIIGLISWIRLSQDTLDDSVNVLQDIWLLSYGADEKSTEELLSLISLPSSSSTGIGTATPAAEPTIVIPTASKAIPTIPEDEDQLTAVDREGNPELFANASVYVQAIVSTQDENFARLACLAPEGDRYEYLKPISSPITKPKYFFALDLYQIAHLLPRLLGTVVETIQFLGTEHCILSIVEGRSTDGTYEILKTFQEEARKLGITYHLTTSDLDPKREGNDRIQALADLRNLALAPLIDHPDHFDPDTTVLFINDVALCMEDVLELIHQRIVQKADMTCGMDWINGGANFYDVWISRGMNGDQFFEIAQDGGWEFSENLFWNDQETKERQKWGRPYQVFSCWNGATAFTAKPLMEHKIKFRSVHDGECYLGEPLHFCKDLWKLGYGRIAVVPSVNVGYADEESRKIKEWHGRVSSWVKDEDQEQNVIKWKDKPPQVIKCVPTYQAPSWVPWDQ